MSSNSHTSQDFTEDVHQQVTQSTILYLLQEATKLAPPADENSTSATPRSETYGTSCPNIMHMPKDSSCSSSSEFSGSFSIMRQSSSSSAWEVMRLINQQCEWLLRSGDEEQVQTDSSAFTDTGIFSTSHSCCYSSVFAPPDVCSPPAEIYGAPPTNDLSDESNKEETEETDALAELIMNNTVENVCLSNRSENYSRENMSVLHVMSGHETHGSDSVALSTDKKSEHPGPEICPVDFTSCLVSEQDGENMWLSLNAYENTQTLGEPAPPRSADINNNLVESLDKELQEPQEIQEAMSPQPSCGTCRRTLRKQLHPARSPDPQDPDMQGVTFSMHPKMGASMDQCRLIITSNYSERVGRFRRTRSSRLRALQTSQRTSSSEEESDSCGPSKGKVCASCRTRKTPLWRDAEDGTPLCNACGIRYKKYRVRCRHCWNIPKKDANTNSTCLKCGDVLKPAQKCSGW